MCFNTYVRARVHGHIIDLCNSMCHIKSSNALKKFPTNNIFEGLCCKQRNSNVKGIFHDQPCHKCSDYFLILIPVASIKSQIDKICNKTIHTFKTKI